MPQWPLWCVVGSLMFACPVVAQEYAPDANTVLLLHLDDTTTEPYFGVLQDSSPNNIQGISAGCLTVPVPGKFGLAREWNPLQSCAGISVPGFHSELDFTTGPFTIELWFRTTRPTMPTSVQLVHRPSDYAYNLWLWCDSYPDRCGPLFYFGDGTHYAQVHAIMALNDGAWHHIAGVRDINEARLYVDGNLVGSADASQVGPLATRGSSITFAGSGWDGDLDEIRFSDKARTLAEFNVALQIGMNIRSGDGSNTINLKSAGVIPVTLLSTSSFDATTINPATVSLAGARVKLVGKSNKYLCQPEDVNGDGIADLVCKVETAQFMIEPGDSSAVLEAETYSGMRVRGEGSVRIVPD
jgi:hypothetical protein